jgi:FkbM family methyltransferase
MRTQKPNAMSLIKNQVRYAKRLIRVMQGTDLLVPVQMKCPKVTLGNEQASWCVCPRDLSAQSVIYSFGVGQDVSFDLALIQRLGAHIHAFDPTPRSIRWLRTQTLPRSFVFHDYGVADYDGLASFSPPQNPCHVSYSMIAHQRAEALAEGRVYRLGTIMQMLGHTKIDLLKMDIEGAEYDVLRDLVSGSICVDQILVEFHHRWPDLGVQKTKDAVRDLNRMGYKTFHISPSGEEFSFRKVGSGPAESGN